MHIRILSILPRFPQLRIIPGKGSPLLGLVGNEGMILSYDNQRNYPLACAPYAVARQLQSALSNDQIEMSILNLAAVPRELSLNETWQQQYLSDIVEAIPYGRSTIVVRQIGMTIEDVSGIQQILRNNDIIVVPISFETHVPEIIRIAAYVKRVAAGIALLASGTGVWGHENQLLNAGFDCVYTGTVQDGGEKILLAILEGDKKSLSEMSGMNFFFQGQAVSNPAPRSFRQTIEERARSIARWQDNLPKYYRWVTPQIQMVGRPDLTTGLNADSLLEYSNSFQDLPPEAVARQSQAGLSAIFAADEFSPVSGCPRECDFCHAAGKGYSQRDEKYIISLLQQYAEWGVTDLIPTDDQFLLAAAGNAEAAERQIKTFEEMSRHGMRFYLGNGVETASLQRLIQKSGETTYQRWLDLFLDRLDYLYLPLEEEALVLEQPTRLRKLRMGLSGFEQVLSTVNDYSHQSGRAVEVATNIILSPTASETDIRAFYKRMSQISAAHPSLTRYTCFFMIPSSSAPHSSAMANQPAISHSHSSLKLVSVPQLIPMGQDTNWLEGQLAAHLRVRGDYSTRRLQDGTYH